MSEFLAEFIGTTVLIFLGCGVVANVLLKGTKGNNSGLLVITTAWGLSVFVGVIIAGPISGAHLNPAVTLTLALVGKFPWVKVLPYMTAQLLGAILGSFLIWIFYSDHFKITDSHEEKLGVFVTSPAIKNYPINLISEILATLILVFVVLFIKDGSFKGEKEIPIGLGSVGALPVALLVWVIGLSLGGTTGYAINPARDLGPRIMYSLVNIKHKADFGWRYSWIPVFGPFIGALLAAGIYRLIN